MTYSLAVWSQGLGNRIPPPPSYPKTVIRDRSAEAVAELLEERAKRELQLNDETFGWKRQKGEPL